jgi:hypothetical protein
MPEGVGYEIWSDANPPPTGMQNEFRDGMLWDRGNGERYLVKGGQFFPLDEKQWAKYAAKPAAQEQAEALSSGGMSARDASATTANTSRYKGSAVRMKSEGDRASTERAVQNVMSAERAAQSGPMGGLSLAERTAVTKLMREEGLSEEEAVEVIRKMSTAGEQSEALER